MMLFRAARESDLDGIHRLAVHSGTGMTTFPKDRELLAKRLAWSFASFQKRVKSAKNEYYLFVLEDPLSSRIVGLAAIEAATGYDAPFYSYKLSRQTGLCNSLKIRSDYEILSLVNDNQGRSELCTLFLEPAFRHDSNGLLLSRARFLFIAQYPHRFTPLIIAELRGISDEKGDSPFWDHVGRHFFHMTFAEADDLTLSSSKQFIADLMPRDPLYVSLLAPAAQAVIGRPHQSTVPAMNILVREGFRYKSYVDIFDAGPTLEVARSQIQTIAKSRLLVLKSLSEEVSSQPFLLANGKLDFRATLSTALFNLEEESCIISKKTAELLQIKLGDCLRIAPLQIETGDPHA